jgi:putative transposase
VKTLFIEPGRPWENGYCESFNSKLRDELLNGEIFTTPRETRPHSSLGYRLVAPEAILPPAGSLSYASLRSAHGLAKPAGTQTLSNWDRFRWAEHDHPGTE